MPLRNYAGVNNATHVKEICICISILLINVPTYVNFQLFAKLLYVYRYINRSQKYYSENSKCEQIKIDILQMPNKDE